MPMPSRAASRVAMSSLFVWNIACTARATPSGSPAKNSVTPSGVICHESPLDGQPARYIRGTTATRRSGSVVHHCGAGQNRAETALLAEFETLAISLLGDRSLSRPRLRRWPPCASGRDTKGRGLATAGPTAVPGRSAGRHGRGEPSVGVWPAGLARPIAPAGHLTAWRRPSQRPAGGLPATASVRRNSAEAKRAISYRESIAAHDSRSGTVRSGELHPLVSTMASVLVSPEPSSKSPPEPSGAQVQRAGRAQLPARPRSRARANALQQLRSGIDDRLRGELGRAMTATAPSRSEPTS